MSNIKSKIAITLAATVLVLNVGDSLFSNANTLPAYDFDASIQKDSYNTYQDSLIIDKSKSTINDLIDSQYSKENIETLRLQPDNPSEKQHGITVVKPYNNANDVYNITFSNKSNKFQKAVDNKFSVVLAKLNNAEYESAEAILDAVVLNDRSLSGWDFAKAASLYEMANNKNKAIFAYEKAVYKLPNRFEVLYNYSLCLSKSKYFDKARYNLLKVININPEYMLAHYNLGNVYFQQKDYLNALRYFNNSISINPMSADSYYNIALTLETMNYKSLAIKYYKKCTKISPNDNQAKQAIKRLAEA